MTQKEFYKTKSWQRVADMVRKRDHYTCTKCGKIPAVYVHHIIELNDDNVSDTSIALNMENLTTLCRQCHEETHGRIVKRFKILENGEVISTR